MKQPPFLKTGDHVRLIAPSFGVTTEPYQTREEVAVKRWSSMGFIVEEGVCVHRNDGMASSAPPEERAKEFMQAYASDASLILSVGGGETMNEILPFVDFERIRHLPPKWFMGFSDNTNLVFPLVTLADTMAIYGPCAPQFFQKRPRLSEKDALALLKGSKRVEGYPKYSITRSNPDRPLLPYRLSQKKVITPFGGEEPMEGIFLGGCLDCLLGICGTRFDNVKSFLSKQEGGIVWFLESCDLSPLGIRRGLFQLREAGWFDTASGFLIGRPLCGKTEMFGLNASQAVTDILSPLGKPIWLNVDLGHIPPSMPFKAGAKGKASLQDGNLVVEYAQ